MPKTQLMMMARDSDGNGLQFRRCRDRRDGFLLWQLRTISLSLLIGDGHVLGLLVGWTIGAICFWGLGFVY